MDIEEVNQLIRDSAVLLSLLTFFLGLAVGNRLAIGRDKRKELNEAAKPIRAYLLSEEGEPSPYRRAPSEKEVDVFANSLPIWKKKAFLKRWARLYDARMNSQKQDNCGQVSYGNKEEIRKAVKLCIPYTKRA